MKFKNIDVLKNAKHVLYFYKVMNYKYLKPIIRKDAWLNSTYIRRIYRAWKDAGNDDGVMIEKRCCFYRYSEGLEPVA